MVNDRYLTGEDYEFAKLVYDDIEKFVNCPGEKRALLFPAVNSRRRFLIHHTVADYFPNLASLSVGEGEQRRTAVTLKQQLEQHQLLQEKHQREKQLLREDEERERQRERLRQQQQEEEATLTQRGRNLQQEQYQQRRECSQESSNSTIDRKQRNKQQQQHRYSPDTQDSDAGSRQQQYQQQQRGKNRNNKENADSEERKEPEKKEGRRRNRKRDKRGSSSALSLQQKEQEEQQGNNRNRRQQQQQDDTRLKHNQQQQQSKNPKGGENFGGNPIRKSASSSAVLCPTEDGGCSSSEQPERKSSKRRRRDTKRRNRNNNEKNKKDGEEEVEELDDRKGSRAQSRESSAKPKEHPKNQHQEYLEVSSVNGECHTESHTSKNRRRRGSRRSPSKSVPVPPESSGSEQYNADGELAPQSRANTSNITTAASSATSAGRKVKRSGSSVSTASNCECDPRRDGPERRDQRSTPERSKALGSWRTGEGVVSSPSPSSSSNASSRRGSSTQTAERNREEQTHIHHYPPYHHHHHTQQQHQSEHRSSTGLVASECTTQTSACNSLPRDCSPSSGKSPSRSGCVMPVSMTADLEINNKVKRGKGVSAAIYRPPPARRDGPLHPSPQSDLIQTSTPTSSVSRPRAKRPDQRLYVPKGRRYGPHDAPTPDMEPRPPSPAYSVASESSGRNRYNNRNQQGSHLSIYDEDLDEHSGAPLHNDLRDLSRESTPAYGNNKGNSAGGLFSKQTLQLIERCMNQDRQDSWENSSVNSSPSPKNNRRYTNGGANVCKSPTPKRDLDSVHSKENVLLPNDQVPTRTRKNRRNRRRGSRSRDQLNDQSNKDQSSRTPQRNTPNTTPSSSEWVFYNSSYDHNSDRYDNRGYDNYDRYSSSRNNSKASSRNSSRERQQQYQHHQQSNSNHHTPLDWRNRGNNVNTSYSIPSSPAKGYTHPGYQHSRNSAKPPSGRLGSLPNVALDFGDTRRRSLTEQTANNTSPKNTSPRATKSIEESTSTSMSPHSYTQPSRTPCSSLNNSCSSNSSPHIIPDTHEHFTPIMSDISERVEPSSANQDQTYPNSQTVESNTQVISSQEHRVSPSIEPDVSTSDQNDHIDTRSCSPNASSHTTAHTHAYEVEDVHCHETEQHTSGSVNSDLAEEESKPEDAQKEETKEEEEKPAEEENSPPKEGLKKNPKKFSFNWADEVEDSWDSMYDETGECLDPELKKQLDSNIGKVTFEEPEHDYYNYQAKDSSPVLMNDAEYSHVIEIYDFPVSFKTQDLLSIFGNFQNTGFDIKWVDDTHALGVFTTALIASEALNIDHPFLKTRPLTLATRASKAKALRITEALLPYKPRPETSAALARRLVSGALGLKVNVSREVREAEKQKLKDAKAKKRLAAKQREDAWEGTIV
ncbi:uncharacterized protein LOC143025564 isoform X2 [Oratosquilla oratoria]|uniref:uncharacterized protein LOC143025564 isoform X2 n=1 Tax=Oratosquilla oratoria TaxID=337810 RepID=UPI003F76F449